MAAIITDLTKDIQKLQELKNEIENVKKSLKGINIKVNLDIKENLESQLQGLMAQYHAVAQKISDTEGKIMISTKRINDAVENIAKANAKVSKPQTETVQTQDAPQIKGKVKEYEELKSAIESVIGTRTQNARLLVEEQAAVDRLNREIKVLRKEQGESGQLSSSQKARLAALNDELLTHKIALAEVRQNLNNNVKMENAAEDSMDRMSQALSRMRIAYRAMSDTEKRSQFGKDLLVSIDHLDTKLKTLDASIGNHQRNVGNYASGFNGLDMSVQQIVRELPAASMGLNTFFLGISNNIPILTDNIKRVVALNKELAASGQKVVPVTKQLISSLFSWQTTMMVGITMLSMHGKEIVEWAKTALKGKDAALSMRDALDKMNESMDFRGVGEQIAQFRKLAAEYQAIGDNAEEKRKFIEKYNEEIERMGVSITDVTGADNLFIDNSDAFIESIKQRAAAMAGMKLASEQYAKAIEKQIKDSEKLQEHETRLEMLQSKPEDYTESTSVQTSTFGTFTTITSTRDELIASEKKVIDSIKQRAKEYENAGDAYIEASNKMIKESKKTLSDTGIKTIENTGEGNDEKQYNDIGKQISKLLDKQTLDRIKAETDAENQVEQARIDALHDGFEKEQAQRALNNKKELEELERQKQEYIRKVVEQEEAIFNAREEAKSKSDPTYKKQSFDSEAATQRHEKSNPIVSQIDKVIEYTVTKQRNESGTPMADANALVSEYQSALDKRQQLLISYLEDMDALETQYAETGDERFLRSAEEREKVYKESVASLDEETNAASSAISRLFGDMKDKSLAELEEIGAKGKEALDFLTSGEWNTEKGEELFITKEQFDLWSKSPEKLKAISDALRDNQQATDALKPAYDKLADGLREIFEAGSDPKQFEQALEKIKEGFNDISNAVSFVSDSLRNMGEALGSDGLGKVADGIDSVLNVANTAIQGVSVGASLGLGPLGAAIGGTIGLVSSLVTEISKIGDNKRQKNIDSLAKKNESLDKSVEKLGNTYDALGKQADKAYSVDASKLIEQQNTLLEQEQKLLEAKKANLKLMIAEEQAKKNVDEEQVAKYKEQLDAIDKTLADNYDKIEENKEAQIEALAGQDMKSAIDAFASAYADAWTNGKDGAEASMKATRDMIRNSLSQYLKTIIEPYAKKFNSALANAMKDGILDDWEKRQLEAIKNNIDREAQDYYEQTEDLWQDPEDKNAQKQEASSKGYDTLSEETGSELSGRALAQYEVTLRIEELAKQYGIDMTKIKDTASEIRTILADSYLELISIRENTSAVIKPIKNLSDKIDKWDSKIMDL